MGRKIPGRKHHGVKDPEKQRLERFNKIKDQINAPPINPDDQQIPKSLQRLAELQAKTKNGYYKIKKSKKRGTKKLFEQAPHETSRQFIHRVNKFCDVVKREAAFEMKYGVEIKRNEHGEVESVSKRPKDPLQIMLKQVRNEKKKKKKNDNGDSVVKLTKSQKRSLKLKEKKMKKKNKNLDEFVKFQDKVQFGEQVHAPPTLVAPRRVKIENLAPRPGKKDLLLKSVFSGKTDNKVIDKTKKRKDLPYALRRQLEQQQQEAIEAYKMLKKRKLN